MKEYKYTINGNKYEVVVGDITDNIATLTVNGVTIANIVIPEKAEGETNGFFDVEYPLPASLLRNKQGKATAKFVVRLSADGTTPNPGWYGLRLVRTNK